MINPMMLMQNLQAFKADPTKFILQRGFNLPANVGTDPQSILNHLVRSGQVSQQQIDSAYKMMQRYR